MTVTSRSVRALPGHSRALADATVLVFAVRPAKVLAFAKGTFGQTTCSRCLDAVLDVRSVRTVCNVTPPACFVTTNPLIGTSNGSFLAR